MRFIQNVEKIKVLHWVSLCNMQMDLMKWLFTGELAFDMLFIQLSWHCGKITFLGLFLIHTFTQFTNSNGANTARSCRAAERTMHWNNVQMEHFRLLSTNETNKSWKTSSSYRTWIWHSLLWEYGVHLGSSLQNGFCKWLTMVIHAKVSITTPLSWAYTPLSSQMITSTPKCLAAPQMGQTCFLHYIQYS